MNEHELKRSLSEAFRSAGLSRYVIREQGQLFEVPEGFFVETVLSDGSKLDNAEKVIALARRDVEAQGAQLISVLRAIWSVKKVEGIGPSRDKSGGIKSAYDFRAILESGECATEVTVEVTWPALKELKQSVGDDHVMEAVRDFLRLQLSWGGAGYWDPVRHPRQTMNEAAASYLLARRPVTAA